MLELMIKMALCLLGALVLGFIIGWLLSKYLIEKKYLKKVDDLSTNLLRSEDAVKKLKEINFNKEENKNTKEYNQSLLKKNIELERLLEQNKKEISAFEGILMKAEKIIEERNNKITLLENKRKKENLKDVEELVITKDQFSYIEVQLSEYQKEIAKLKEINRKLQEKCSIKLPLEKETHIKKDDSEVDDSTLVKLFEDTYKKIIKS
ncbi:hypothetical protein MNB_SV-14-279 [hydrothermal vent metagenome]|uniref:Uncharacterized protein n=1 Tax=hydrothermal vent metagenome TaxID=652676 RepID=A0A1W1C6J4_9ZZZZ